MPSPAGGNVPDWLSLPGLLALFAAVGKGLHWLVTRKAAARREEVDTFGAQARDTGTAVLATAKDVILLLREDLAAARGQVKELDGTLAALQARLAKVEEEAAAERRQLRREFEGEAAAMASRLGRFDAVCGRLVAEQPELRPRFAGLLS
jgi:hypothetical protein